MSKISTTMMSFARATFLFGIQLLAKNLHATHAAQYTDEEIDDIFVDLSTTCTGFDLCNPEWTESTFDGWERHQVTMLIRCQIKENYDYIDHHVVEMVRNDLYDIELYDSLDRQHFVYSALDFSDDVVEAGKCNATHMAPAPAPGESLDTICGSVGYYGNCHSDWTKSSLDGYTNFALKELIRCQVRKFEDILDKDDVDIVMSYLQHMNTGALRRTVLEFNSIANAEYCDDHDADAPTPAPTPVATPDMPDDVSSSGLIYSSIGWIIIVASYIGF